MAHYSKTVNGEITEVLICEPQYFADNQQNFADFVKDDWGDNIIASDVKINYAFVNVTYLRDINIVFAHKPYPTWRPSPQTGLWEPPTPYPTDGKAYRWDEGANDWTEK